MQMKLMKVGGFWYADSGGRLVRSSSLTESKEAWVPVVCISGADCELLGAEFGDALVEGLSDGYDPSHVTEVAMEDPASVAKYDSWHVTMTTSSE